MLSDAEFIKAWAEAGGSPARMAQRVGMTERAVYRRRINLERRGTVLQTNPSAPVNAPYAPPSHFERRRRFEVTDGTVVVFSDPHWMPDHDPIGQNVLETVIRKIKPQLIVCGGDALDGHQISGRFPPTRGHHIGFSLREQLDCMKLHFEAIQKVAGKAQFGWTLGNHDLRLSRYVAVQAEHLLDLDGTRLEDWAPGWPLSWTIEINAGTDMVVVRHRNQPGMLHLQGAKAGCHYVHGHRHKLGVHLMPTFSGPTYSVDCGSIACPHSDAFDYQEGNIDHAQGFCVLTFRKGKLMPPELVHIIDGEGWFRGALV